MLRDRFTDARLITRYDPSAARKTNRKLKLESDEDWAVRNLRTVNAYRSWLRQMGRGYEIRLHHQRFYLIKSFEV